MRAGIIHYTELDDETTSVRRDANTLAPARQPGIAYRRLAPLMWIADPCATEPSVTG
jgi:hypothetical protein